MFNLVKLEKAVGTKSYIQAQLKGIIKGHIIQNHDMSNMEFKTLYLQNTGTTGRGETVLIYIYIHTCIYI
jgi:hypothetical protein